MKNKITPEEGQLLFKALSYFNTSTVVSPTEAQLEHFTQLAHKLLPEPEALQESEVEEVINALYYYEASHLLELTGEESEQINKLLNKLDPQDKRDRPPYQAPAEEPEGLPEVLIALTNREQALHLHIMLRYAEMYCDEMTPETEYVFNCLWDKVRNCQAQPDQPLPQLPEYLQLTKGF